MPDSSLEKLRNAFANAATGEVMLNDDFWTAAGLTPPTGFTAGLKAAYRLSAAAAGLEITFHPDAVSQVANGQFNISGVTLAFLNASPAPTATVYGIAGAVTPVLGIDMVPGGWELADYFPGMAGINWPFALLQFSQQRFFFTSAPQVFSWMGVPMNMATGQNLYGLLTVPAPVQPLFQLIGNLPPVASAMVMYGPVVLDKADNETILFPEMDLGAPIAAGQEMNLLGLLTVINPTLGFDISTVSDSEDEDGELLLDADDQPTTETFQTPYFYFSTEVIVTGTDGQTLPLALRATIDATASSYEFSVATGDADQPITPASIVALMAGSGFFQYVPAVLQEYLASVQLIGFTVSGALQPKPGITMLSTMLGSVQDHPIPLFSDPTTSQVFELDGFSLTWVMLNPLDAPARQNLVTLGATFKLFPEVFRTKDGQPGGLFEIEIDQALNFEGAFKGKASFDDMLRGITDGAIGLPEGIEVDFSDIYLTVRPSEKAYALGCTVDAQVDVPFISGPSGQPLIQVVGLNFKLGATTPKGKDAPTGKTVYTGSIDGQIIVGPVAANVRIDYDGAGDQPRWQLEASLAQPLPVSDLLNQFFRAYDLPALLGTLVVEAFDLKATIPSEPTPPTVHARRGATRPARHLAGPSHPHGWRSPVRPVGEIACSLSLRDDPPPALKSSYQVSGKINWTLNLTTDLQIQTVADIGLSYDANRPAGQEFAGSVIADITIESIGVTVQIGYRFGTATQDVADLSTPPTEKLLAAAAADADSTVLWMAWNGFRAEYSFDDKVVTFSMKGWTVGSLLTALVEMLGVPYFTLPSPWNVLDQISLDGLSIKFDLHTGVKYPVSASYTLPSPVDFGFFKLEGLHFKQVDGKVTLSIDGKITVPGLSDTDLFKPDSDGQDVTDMPAVPGQGNAYFHLYLLALGQRVAIADPGSFDSTQAVIAALGHIPKSDRPDLPFDPGTQIAGQPYYNRSSDWLAALHFGVLLIPGTSQYSFDLMIVFNDPALYGLRLALNGDKVKVLAGLVIDVLYKKITDDIGCYQIEFTLPSVLRNLEFGAFSVTLPVIGLQIYTNGDFLFDFGFPYNMDFSRSFTVQAIILGVPVLGSAGFYFGKLSNATAPGLPVTTKGSFHPVIVFGFGAQLGIGKTIDKGILKAGFSITVFGIIEGTIAAWHPYQSDNRGDPNEVQGDYYFRVTGTFGIIGKLFGSIDFAVIKADVSLTVTVYAQIAYESFRKIPLSLSASVQVTVSIKIDLGLFSISISLSFSTTITEQLTIGSDSVAPWDGSDPLAAAGGLRFDRHRALVEARTLPLPRTLFEHGIVGKPFRLDFARPHAALRAARAAGAADDRVPLEITATTQFTVLAPEGAGYAQQEGGLVLLFAMDAPQVSTDPAADPGGDTSFGKLCGALLPWIIASVAPEGDSPLPPLAPGSVSRPLLEGILKTLSDPAQAPFTAQQLKDFLSAKFIVTVSAAQPGQLAAGFTIFPAVDFLSMTVPNPANPTAEVTIAYDAYVTATSGYQSLIRTIFQAIAANVGSETKAPPAAQGSVDDPQPLTATVFADYFVLLARQLVQSAIDGFDDFPYPLSTTTSLQSIIDAANGWAPGQLTPTALASANLSYPLMPGLTLDMADVGYMVQVGDTLASVAARYADPALPASTNPASLILNNRQQGNLIHPGVAIQITVAGAQRSYTTRAGDDFDAVAAALQVTTEELSLEAGLYTVVGLLASAVVTTIPDVSVTTVDGDTIAGIIERLNVPKQSFLTAANLTAQGLFKVDPKLRFAVPGLVVLPEDRLWPAILATGTLGQTAGLAARYMLHGMRLPVAAGLTIPDTGFLYGSPHWNAEQTGYGVYQLTGQQFPLAARATGYVVTLTRPAGTPNDWFQLGGGTSLALDITTQTVLLSQVVASAKTNGYRPSVPSLTTVAETDLAPRRFGVASHASWLTSDMADLVRICQAPSPERNLRDAAAGPQVKALLFNLSSALLSSIEATQAALATNIPTVAGMQPYLPVLSPAVGTTDPATSVTTYTELDDYSLATRIDFQIKHLAQDADLAPPQPLANDVIPPGVGNPGSPAHPLAPFAYEIIGPNPAQTVLLERLLTAMASEGEGLVSGLFLLYADVNDGSNGLASRAPAEFLSFIVQSNLSTETNPPAQAETLRVGALPPPSTGIANQPAEFIKLLWELGTVNSAGTYLFYQLLADGTGLPPALFDGRGVATLTLVASIRRDGSLPRGQRMFNAVNALVTTAPIDPLSSIVELKGLSAPATSLNLPSDVTPAGIAAQYGISLGGLGQSNADAPLAATRQIPIAGLYRQLTPDDVAAGQDPIADLAAYYSSGAVTPLTKDGILAFNPGVAVAALSVFRIPDFTYAVAPGGPGASFNLMAAYYRTGVFDLIQAARDVSGLFVSPTLTIDPIALNATPKLGLGNAALNLERERGSTPNWPANPSQSDIDAYTEATLLQLYQLLSARIVETPFFKESSESAAFGPHDPAPSDPDPEPPRARPLRRCLASVATGQPYLFDQAVGYGSSSLVNPAPQAGTPGLPLASANPYVGIGTLLQLGIDWQDLFGNRVPNPFNQLQAGDPPPYGQLPIPLLYADRLLPMDAWPSTTRSYCYHGDAGQPVLNFVLKFDATPYEPAASISRGRLQAVRLGDDLPIWQRNAAADLAKFQTVYFQLNQNYDGLNVPGLAGAAVTMSLVNSLLAAPEQPLTPDARDKILGYVNRAIVYLDARATGRSSPAPLDTTIQWPVDVSALTDTSEIIRLETSIRFTRQSGLVAPALRALDDGTAVLSDIPADGEIPAAPKPDGSAEDDPAETYPVALAGFAGAFEKAFVTADWQMRVGTSPADPSTPNAARQATVWVVRMAVASSTTPKGIGFQIGNAPVYFAPLPIASKLQTLTLDIQQYRTGAPYPNGSPVHTTFTSVDPNVWLAECLTAVDDILSPSYSTPLFQLDRLLGLNEDSAKPADAQTGYLTRLLQYKKTLASAISSTATSVLVQPAADLKPAAVAKLEQALLRKLSSANTLTCVAVLPVSRAHYAPAPAPGVTAPRLFGQPLGTLSAASMADAAGKNDNFAFSTAKIPLISAEGDDASTLAFLVTSRSAEAGAYLELALEFSLTHVEHDIHGVPGIENYEQSRWITLLTNSLAYPIQPATGDNFAIPVALRALPAPATVVSQTGVPSVADPLTVSPGQLKVWNYGFSYLLRQAAQDSVIAEVVFNQPSLEANALAGAVPENLYNALAQFVAIYPAVARDLQSALRPIDGVNLPDDPPVLVATDAVKALDTVLAAVTAAYDAWAKAQPDLVLAQAPVPSVVYQFEIVLEPDQLEGRARIEILPQSFKINDAVAFKNFLPLAKVLIDPANYEPEEVSSYPASGNVVWQFKLRADARDSSLPEYLPYEKALENSERKVAFEGLDLFALQNGWASVQVARNRHLSPDLTIKTTPAFAFETAEARFANPLVPLIKVEAYPLDSGAASPQSVSAWLERFFASLLAPAFENGPSETVIVKLETAYSYSVTDGDLASLIPQTKVPVSLLPPTSTDGLTSPPFVDAVGTVAQNWFETQRPLVNFSAGFGFDLTVFSGTGANNLPLLKVNALTLASTNVKRTSG